MGEIRVYPKSVHGNVSMVRTENRDMLKVGNELRTLNHATAEWLRKEFPFTAPIPVLRRRCTMGVGDRLGIATAGHIRVFEEYDATPILAQQSIRELNLTNRTYEDVLDDVTYAVFRENYQGGYGADGDHLKKPEDVEYALGLGYTMLTLDCSEHIHGDGGTEEISEALRDKYIGKEFALEDGITLRYTERELGEILHTYGEALDFAAKIYHTQCAGRNVDFELSIDETATPTTPSAHYFVANELRERGVELATLAPRFCGEFQKGIDYIGDIAQFDAEMAIHAAIARRFGYKLSIHSGSDKFGVFPSIGKHTKGNFHVKTAGTNWLIAMEEVARHAPELYREVHAYALTAFDAATKYYHVTTNLNNIPKLSELKDEELPELFAMNDARQLIHITYGLILNHGDFRQRLYGFWAEYAEEYAQALQKHIGKHLTLLGVEKRK